MIRRLLTPALMLLSSLLVASRVVADAAAAGGDPGDDTTRGADVSTAESTLPAATQLDAAAPGPEWQTLFDTVAAQGAVFATFTEKRWFSVRKEPVTLRGELRHSPERGLSLRYVSPEEQMMIIDDKGIVLRNAAGRSRSLKGDPRAPQVDAMLLHVLRFDMVALERLFEIRGGRDGDHWQLDLTPRTPELTRAIGHLVVGGDGMAVRRLEFARGAKQRVQVLIEETRTGVTFTAEELAKYFR